MPLTIIWDKSLFWFVKSPKIYSRVIPNEDFNNNIKNYRELSLSEGSLVRFIFLTSTAWEPTFLGLEVAFCLIVKW